MGAKTHSIHLRLTPEDTVVLNSLAEKTGTSPTNYVRKLVKRGMVWETGELLVEASSIDNIVSRAVEEQSKKLENRLAGLLVKGMVASFESKGMGVYILRQIFESQNLSESEINRRMSIIKNAIYKTAKAKVSNRSS